MIFYFWRFLLAFKHLIFSFLKAFRKALCFRQQKKLDEDIPLEVVVLGTNQKLQQQYGEQQPNYQQQQQQFQQQVNYQQQQYQHQQYEQQQYQQQQQFVGVANPQQADEFYNNQQEDELEWDDWAQENAQPATAQDEENKEEEEINYFEDMEPKVKIKKVIVKKVEKEERSNLLKMNENLPVSSELSDWVDDDGTAGGDGWDEELCDEDEIMREIREQRRSQREQQKLQRQQHKIRNQKQEKRKLAARIN